MKTALPYPADVFVQMLQALDHILGAASTSPTGAREIQIAHAKLAPDMFDLSQHVELTCRHALEAEARLVGQSDAVSMTLGGGTLEELQNSVRRTIEHLRTQAQGRTTQRFDAEVEVHTTTGQMFLMSGRDMLDDWAFPQFYFHLVTVYATLRNNGVGLGIRDYLGHMRRHLVSGEGASGDAQAAP